jgi:hypothetical protein
VSHVVRTSHIQRLIREALALSEEVDMREGFDAVDFTDHTFTGDQVLARASNLLRHAAEELEDERMACFGWDQV